VTFEVASGPGVLAGSVLSFTNAGQVSIVASQAGDENWNAAAGVTNVFLVSKATAEVTLQNLAQVYDGMPRVVTATTLPPGLTVVVMYDGATPGTVTVDQGTPVEQWVTNSPVAIASNTVYMASYHANNGHYSADVN
jgi:hypothetical protein